MKKMLKTLALLIYLFFALATFAFADVALGPMIAIIGGIYVLIAAVVIIAIVLVVKLIIKMVKNKK